MDKELLKYNVSDLSLSINEACKSIELAIKSQNNGNEYAVNHYKEQCKYWAERAVNAVYALGLNPDKICPKQKEWAERF